MTRAVVSTAFLTGLLVLASPAVAQELKGRFSMSPVDGGFVRLDTETGAMSHCTRKDDRWNCEAMGDAVGETRQEIDRLKKENGDLRAEIKRLDDMLGLGDGRRPGALGEPNRQGPAFRLPTEKEVDGALDYFENMMRKLQERMKRLEQNREAPDTTTPAPAPAPDSTAPTPPKRAL